MVPLSVLQVKDISAVNGNHSNSVIGSDVSLYLPPYMYTSYRPSPRSVRLVSERCLHTKTIRPGLNGTTCIAVDVCPCTCMHYGFIIYIIVTPSFPTMENILHTLPTVYLGSDRNNFETESASKGRIPHFYVVGNHCHTPLHCALSTLNLLTITAHGF